VSEWSSSRASIVLAALRRIGWVVARQKGSHRVLTRAGSPSYVFAFHDRDEIGPKMLARIARHTGLKPEDLPSNCALLQARSLASRSRTL
jgi:predicted RNA binding protein YcfA (HicA-like mRNA interferase family)